jgi:ADP-ribose pyrophosphatase
MDRNPTVSDLLMMKNIPITEEQYPGHVETVFQNKYLTVRLVPSRWGPHISAQSGNGGGAVLLVADVTQPTPKILLVNQPRYALTTDGKEHNGYYTWELPRGGRNANETALECAVRELREETNLEQTPSSVLHLGTTYVDSGIMNTEVDYFYVEIDSSNPEINYNDNEVIQHEWVDLDRFKEALVNNEIKDSFTLMAYAKAVLHNKLT